MFKNMYIYRGIVAQFTKKHKSNSPVLCVIAGFRSSVLFSCTSPFDKAHFSRRCNYSALVYIPTHCSRYVICDIVPFVTACARYRLLFDIGVQIKPASGTISSKAFAIRLLWLFVHLNRAHRPVFVALHMHIHK